MSAIKILAAPSIRRLPSYLRAIRRLANGGDGFISATVIAEELSLEPIQVRKDLALTGINGSPRRGYPVDGLIDAIERFLGWAKPQDAILVGAGHLGSALLGYQELASHGLHIVAAFDINSKKIGRRIYGTPIFSIDSMEINIRNFGAKISILTVPGIAAQSSADLLARSGIEGIWNFTSVKLRVPDTITVIDEDISSGYAMLSVSLGQR
jgi:redox-sensing transcriptional repressor